VDVSAVLDAHDNDFSAVIVDAVEDAKRAPAGAEDIGSARFRGWRVRVGAVKPRDARGW
jgi:hypothetical protein